MKIHFNYDMLMYCLVWNNQGDRERDIEGMEISPMMDRHNASIEKSQVWTTSWIHWRPRPQYAKEFESGDFTLKTHQMFCVHTTKRNLKTHQSPVMSVWLVFEENANSVREIIWLLWLIRFRKAPFSNCFPSVQKRKAFYQIPPVWRAFKRSSVFMTD